MLLLVIIPERCLNADKLRKRETNDAGLKRLCETNHEPNLSMRLIPALSFVPVGWSLLLSTWFMRRSKKKTENFDPDQNITETLHEVASYFQRIYLKGETIGRNSC